MNAFVYNVQYVPNCASDPQKVRLRGFTDPSVSQKYFERCLLTRKSAKLFPTSCGLWSYVFFLGAGLMWLTRLRKLADKS